MSKLFFLLLNMKNAECLRDSFEQKKSFGTPGGQSKGKENLELSDSEIELESDGIEIQNDSISLPYVRR